MQTYNCPSCIHQFSEGSRDWAFATESAECPACQMPLRNFYVHNANSNQLAVTFRDESGQCGTEGPTLENPTDLTLRINDPSLVGVKGWLFLLMLELAFLGPLFFFIVIFTVISQAEGQSPELKASLGWTKYKALLWLTYLCLSAVSIWGGYGLARIREWRSVTRAMIVLWTIGPTGILIIGLLPYAVFGNLIERIDPDLLPNVIGHLILAFIWTLYLSTSKRVRATYSRSPA